MRRDVPVEQPFVTGMAEAAIGMHEFFMTFVNAGFSRKEALDLTKHQLTLAHECPNHQPTEE